MSELKTTAEFRKKYRSDGNPMILWLDREFDTDLGISDFDLLDDIDTLLAENKRLREALLRITEMECSAFILENAQFIARKALGEVCEKEG